MRKLYYALVFSICFWGCKKEKEHEKPLPDVILPDTTTQTPQDTISVPDNSCNPLIIPYNVFDIKINNVTKKFAGAQILNEFRLVNINKVNNYFSYHFSDDISVGAASSHISYYGDAQYVGGMFRKLYPGLSVQHEEEYYFKSKYVGTLSDYYGTFNDITIDVNGIQPRSIANKDGNYNYYSSFITNVSLMDLQYGNIFWHTYLTHPGYPDMASVNLILFSSNQQLHEDMYFLGEFNSERGLDFRFESIHCNCSDKIVVSEIVTQNINQWVRLSDYYDNCKYVPNVGFKFSYPIATYKISDREYISKNCNLQIFYRVKGMNIVIPDKLLSTSIFFDLD